MAMVKPQNAGLNAQPIASFESPKMPPSATGPNISSIFALIAKVRAVTNSAKQLPINSLSLL